MIIHISQYNFDRINMTNTLLFENLKNNNNIIIQLNQLHLY